MREREQRCGACAHARKYEYQPMPASISAGMPDRAVKIQCRRFPPVVVDVGTNDDPIAAWPSMNDADWCGEWRQSLDPAD